MLYPFAIHVNKAVFALLLLVTVKFFDNPTNSNTQLPPGFFAAVGKTVLPVLTFPSNAKTRDYGRGNSYVEEIGTRLCKNTGAGCAKHG